MFKFYKQWNTYTFKLNSQHNQYVYMKFVLFIQQLMADLSHTVKSNFSFPIEELHYKSSYEPK